MGNPIQYHNPNNIHHKYRGGLVITRGGFRKTAFIVVVRPPRGVPRGGLMKTFHRRLLEWENLVDERHYLEWEESGKYEQRMYLCETEREREKSCG